jgi:shikimate dehydrogenase
MNQLFGSISSSPGTIGKYYYSEFFKYYGIIAQYDSMKATDIKEVRNFLENKLYSGFNISMPFKTQIIRHLDAIDHDVSFYNSCNTIKFQESKLHGYNTDIYGVLKIVDSVCQNDYVLVLGNGAVGKMIAKVLMLRNIGFEVISRSLNNWNKRHQRCDVLINCTSLGTSVLESPINEILGTHSVYDLTFQGHELQKKCTSINYFSGIFFYKEVFLKQFELHTNILPDPEYFDFLTGIRQ